MLPWSTPQEIQTVYGYIRSNYPHNVPEAIVQICFHYFDQNYVVQFRGNRLTQFLSVVVGACYQHKIKFNPNLSFLFCVFPNGRHKSKGQTIMEFQIKSMLNKIDYVIVALQMGCYESLQMDSYRNKNRNKKFKYEQNQNQVSRFKVRPLCKLKDHKKLIFSLKIVSAQIKYRTDDKITYYPSLSAMQLKETSTLTWNVSSSMIESFKDYDFKMRHDGPIQNNVWISCFPNGCYSDGIGWFQWSVKLLSFPINISKITVKSKITAILENETFETEKEKTIDHDDCKYRISGPSFLRNKLKNKLSFNAELIIKQLYDMNGNEVPRSNWIDHNVMLTK